MALKGGAPDYDGEPVADRWPLDDELREVARALGDRSRRGAAPERDVSEPRAAVSGRRACSRRCALAPGPAGRPDPFELLRGWLAEAADQGMRDPARDDAGDGRRRRAARARASSCCAASTSAGFASTPTAARSRAASWPRTRARSCSSSGASSAARCSSTARSSRALRRGVRRLLRHPPARRAARRLGLRPGLACCAAARSCSTAGPGRRRASPARTSRARDYWGGYRLTPERDRVLAGRTSSACTTATSTCANESAPSGWRIDRLAP